MTVIAVAAHEGFGANAICARHTVGVRVKWGGDADGGSFRLSFSVCGGGDGARAAMRMRVAGNVAQ